MQETWTFGRKLAVGFGLMVALIVLISALAALGLQTVRAETDAVLNTHAANMLEVQRLQTDLNMRIGTNRGYLLTGDEAFAGRSGESGRRFGGALARIRANPLTPTEQTMLSEIEASERAYTAAITPVIQARRAGQPLQAVAGRFEGEVAPLARTLRAQLDAFGRLQAQRLAAARQDAERNTNRAIGLVIAIAFIGALVALVLAYMLTRALTRQIGGAVQDLTSSSAELQAAANQQATGSGEQASALVEVSSTMKELLSTSRQITDSARQVAQIADNTAGVAEDGNEQVKRAMEAVSGIKRQVEVIVAHMVDLGQNSQQIGGILEIIKELAEQTNILAINAAIEAAGAGEHGRRFGVVAEEVRKLADRVGGSAGEIRSLIENIRATSNTTVMATEEGAKAVEAGSREVGELAATFQRIVGSVSTTAEAAREIELSIKQQTTAVEQVNVAINDVAQAAKEMEASSRQTLDTSSELARVSRDLSVLVQPGKRT